ncbi:hypothetical protein F5J12DRAFT_808730 [Pisolithus orientalis]|uniref:uncharacterized protein n=1 Tax=Pisolithus orientalis TaxID=936130 RepID=UPI002224390A|nr:uncharacterized protein F5J12DRAFT_808730 [Pisolithus orientalis]KAI6025562.1 hypothetical protein F5J12DRAFT_808730 [Pisolithus orientalis]
MNAVNFTLLFLLSLWVRFFARVLRGYICTCHPVCTDQIEECTPRSRRVAICMECPRCCVCVRKSINTIYPTV